MKKYVFVFVIFMFFEQTSSGVCCCLRVYFKFGFCFCLSSFTYTFFLLICCNCPVFGFFKKNSCNSFKVWFDKFMHMFIREWDIWVELSCYLSVLVSVCVRCFRFFNFDDLAPSPYAVDWSFVSFYFILRCFLSFHIS